MTAFEYVRPGDVAGAVAMVSGDPRAAYLAGGTSQLDLMLKDAVVDADRLVDIGRLPLHGITRTGDTLRVGALTTMEELAADLTVGERAPVVREALLMGASVQLRNVPDLDVVFVGEPDRFSPIGVKGLGEVGIVGVSAAIANAVYHATGRRIRSLPITVDKLL